MTKPSDQSRAQQESLSAQTQWFHVYKSMFDQGDVAKIGPRAFTIYSAIKSHANYSSGMACPGIELISEKTGISPAQIKRELKVLVAGGFITKEKHGRSNRYTLREKIQVTDKYGRSEAIATWAYVPSTAQRAIADLKSWLVTGNLAGTKTLSIERLNLQINLGGQNTQVDLDSLLADLAKLPASLRDKLRKRLVHSDGFIHGSE